MKEDETNDGTARMGHSSAIDINRQEGGKWLESLIKLLLMQKSRPLVYI